MRKIKKVSQSLIECIITDDFLGMASEMAFMFTIGIFPFMIFLVSFFGFLGSKMEFEQIISLMSNIVPISAMSIIKTFLHQIIIAKSGSLAIISFIVCMVLASNATAVISKGLNRAYNVDETRNFFYVRFLSIMIVFINAMVMFIGVNSIVFGKIILTVVANFVHMPAQLMDVVLLVRWPISFLALFIMAFLNYYLMPNIQAEPKIKKLSTLPGTLFFCIFWLAASWGFSIYVNNFNSYNKVYGTIGAFIVLLMWFYYTSLIILIGGEINSKYYEKLMIEE